MSINYRPSGQNRSLPELALVTIVIVVVVVCLFVGVFVCLFVCLFGGGGRLSR